MRAKRSKQYRKLMHQYALTFGFREPYQVLIDAGIIIAAARFKMRLGQLLQNTLHGNIKPMITQCSIRHLYNYPATTSEEKAEKEQWIEVAKSAERRRCGHHELEEPLTELECIMSCIDPKGNKTNKHKYIVASGDTTVRQALREVAGVPLIYINRSVMILEPMAGRSEDIRERDERGKMKLGLGNVRGNKRKRDVEESSDDEGPVGEIDPAASESKPKKARKSKGPKGPNPLSVKKSKKEKDKSESQHRPGERSTKPQPKDSVVQETTQTSNESKSPGQLKTARPRKRKHKSAVPQAEPS